LEHPARHSKEHENDTEDYPVQQPRRAVDATDAKEKCSNDAKAIADYKGQACPAMSDPCCEQQSARQNQADDGAHRHIQHGQLEQDCRGDNRKELYSAAARVTWPATFSIEEW
jgi:hypothetical protein